MRIALAALVLTLATAMPAKAEIVGQADNGFVVQHSVTVSTDPETTFAMLRTPAKWWDKDHTWTGNAENLYMDAQAGGCFCELIPNEATTESGAPQRTLRGSVQHMQIVYVDPGNMLRLSGALGPLQSEALTGALTFTLKPVKGGTRITMEYVVGGFMRMKTPDIAPAVDKVLVAQLSRLGMALGPLIGAAEVTSPVEIRPEPAVDEPEPEPDIVSTDDGTADEPYSGGAVGALVVDLAPDEGVAEAGPAPDSAVSASGSPAAQPPAAVPGTPKRYKPGTRPLTRPPRKQDDAETGR